MQLHGCYVALVTPFNEQDAIDEEGLRANINFLIGMDLKVKATETNIQLLTVNDL